MSESYEKHDDIEIIKENNVFAENVDTVEQVEEIWKELNPKFPGYKVSNLGRLKLRSGVVSKCSPRLSGYVSVSIINDKGKTKSMFLHVLVGLAFIPNPEQKASINHINGIRHDNRLVNLERVTYKENNNRKVFPNKGGMCSRIAQYDSDDNLVKIWNSMREITNTKIISQHVLSKACKLNEKVNNIRWEYYIEKIDGEEWKELFVNEEFIKVSSEGRIMYHNGYISYGSSRGTGYLKFSIKAKSYQAHDLICRAFKPLENYDFLITNHLDNNKTNNKINNLEWCTQKENMTHAVKYRKSTNHCTRKVKQIDDKGEIVNVFDSIKEAGIKTNTAVQHICEVCKHKNIRAGGFKWEYCDI